MLSANIQVYSTSKNGVVLVVLVKAYILRYKANYFLLSMKGFCNNNHFWGPCHPIRNNSMNS